MDRGAWWATIHGLAKSQTQLSDFQFYIILRGKVKIQHPKSGSVAKTASNRISGFGSPK